MGKRLGLDGYYIIEVIRGEVFLTVFSPIGGEEVESDEVIEEIKRRGFKVVDFDLVKKVVKKAEGVPVVVGKIKERPKGLIKVEVSADEMEAKMRIIAPVESLHPQEIKWELLQNGIVFGIDDEAISFALKREDHTKPILVAKGVPKIDGEDAVVEYVCKGKEVKEGEVIAIKKPPTSGVDGKTVTGRVLKAKRGEDVSFPLGKNTKVSQDGLKLVATASGYVSFKEGKLNVEPIKRVDGDIGPLEGDIDFLGTVVINGNVSGVNVRVEGDLLVSGFVDGASLEALGNIRIGGGVVGKSRVVGGGEISVKLVKNSTLLAKGDIMVDGDVLSSEVEGGGKAEIKGLIIGGILRAKEEIKAKELGFYTEVPTRVEVGTSKEGERIVVLTEEIEKVKEEIERLDFEIKTLLRLKENLGILARDESRRLAWIQNQKDSLTKKIQKKEKELSLLKEKHRVFRGGKISVLEVVHPGVKIRIGGAALDVKEEYRYLTFYAKKGKIEISPYESG